MEDIDGGLHPAVDGQSLDEMRWEIRKEHEYQTLTKTVCNILH